MIASRGDCGTHGSCPVRPAHNRASASAAICDPRALALLRDARLGNAAAIVRVERSLAPEIGIQLTEAERNPLRQPVLIHVLVRNGLHDVFVPQRSRCETCGPAHVDAARSDVTGPALPRTAVAARPTDTGPRLWPRRAAAGFRRRT